MNVWGYIQTFHGQEGAEKIKRQRWFYCEELTFQRQLYSLRCTTEWGLQLQTMPKNQRGKIFEFFVVSGLDCSKGLEPFTTGLDSSSLFDDEDTGRPILAFCFSPMTFSGLISFTSMETWALDNILLYINTPFQIDNRPNTMKNEWKGRVCSTQHTVTLQCTVTSSDSSFKSKGFGLKRLVSGGDRQCTAQWQCTELIVQHIWQNNYNKIILLL